MNGEKLVKLINSLIGRPSKTNHISEIEIENEIIHNDEDISEAFNDFFINIGPKLASEVTNHSTNKRPIYTTRNFWYGTDKIGTDEIWTTYLGSPNFIRTNFIRTKPKIEHSVNG